MSNPTPSNSLAAEAAPVAVRPSRDEDVEAMLDIYRRHIARGVEPAFAHDPEALQPDDIKRRRRNMRAASGRRSRWPRGGLCLCGSVPQTAGLSLHGEAFNLCASRPSACRHRPRPVAGSDRRLRRRGLSADDRLYRCQQRALDRPAHRLRLSAGRLSAVGRLQIRPMGRHDHDAASLGSGGTTAPDVWPTVVADDIR